MPAIDRDQDGLKGQCFQDGEEFLAYAHSQAVPLAVFDVWMPKTSGLEVQSRLHLVSPNTKVIVMTGQEIPGIRATALGGGAFSFPTKPLR